MFASLLSCVRRLNHSLRQSRSKTANSPSPAAVQAVLDESVRVLLSLPILGRRPLVTHQRILVVLLASTMLAFGLLTFIALSQAAHVAQQVTANGQALVQSQRLAKAASQAVLGQAPAFVAVRESSNILMQTLRGLRSGHALLGLVPVHSALQSEVKRVMAPVTHAQKNAEILLTQEQTLIRTGYALRQISQQANELLQATQTLATIQLQSGSPAAALVATGELSMLTQRMGKSASEFLLSGDVNPEEVFLIGKDLNRFKSIVQGLLHGDASLHVWATSNIKVREQLNVLMQLYEQTHSQVDTIVLNLPGLLAARQAQATLIANSEALRHDLQALQNKLSLQSGLDIPLLIVLAVVAVLALLCIVGLVRVQVQDSRQRQWMAERQRQQASAQEEQAKRITQEHQAAIFQLMNELRVVAAGDLTQKATVTQDITSAIANSINDTVAQLCQLVAHVQVSATHVAQTTAQVQTTSTQLLAASTEQLQEIRLTGQSVLDMAARINQVSAQAQESALVARQSLSASDLGLQAVQNTIGGMNMLRDQIRDAARRIKRLGESSQEIGEMTELISSITEQTHVLALNAAIQAACAGEAGRGFSVVAEEVQRLAEYSADATRQIATRVKTIQTDTQDAIAAMERSTQGVVEGTRLTDSAGAALCEIDLVSRRLADLIEQISAFASKEAESANVVADKIQHIFVVTEQTEAGTRSTANQVHELSRIAQELRQSVARFTIAQAA